MKKIIALLLACVMVLGLFAACGNAEAPAETKAPAAETPNTPAQPEDPAEGEVPTITWYSVGGGMPANWDSWTAKVNAYLEEKIGVHLNMQIIDWGSWGERRNVLVQTGADYDIMFAPGGDLVNDATMGACADIEPFLAEVPGLTDLIPAAYFDACRVNGVLYGVPCYKDSSMTNYFVWTKDIVEAYFPEYTEAHTLAEIYEGLKACKENSDEIGMGLASNGFPPVSGQKYDSAGLPDVGIGIAYEGGTEFVPVWEQADIRADLEVLRDMYNDGLINSDAPVLDTFEGMCIVGVAQGWPSAAKGWGEGRGTEVVVSQYEDTVVSTDTVRGSVLTINANSSKKLEAMKLIELVNTDTQLRDWLWYGEEGVNYEYVEEDGVKKVSKINTDWTMAAYTQGTFFIATPEVGSNGYIEIMALNEAATVSPAMGFAPDTSAIADTLANLAAIRSNYASMFTTGADIEIIADMMAELRANGFDECLEEINRQFSEWKANQ